MKKMRKTRRKKTKRKKNKLLQTFLSTANFGQRADLFQPGIFHGTDRPYWGFYSHIQLWLDSCSLEIMIMVVISKNIACLTKSQAIVFFRYSNFFFEVLTRTRQRKTDNGIRFPVLDFLFKFLIPEVTDHVTGSQRRLSSSLKLSFSLIMTSQ